MFASTLPPSLPLPLSPSPSLPLSFPPSLPPALPPSLPPSLSSSQITDQTLSHLALNCQNIKSLVSTPSSLPHPSPSPLTLHSSPSPSHPPHCTQALSHCERITDSGIRRLVGGACFDTLQVLELDNCPLITDQSLEMLRSADCHVTIHTPGIEMYIIIQMLVIVLKKLNSTP